MIEKSHLVEVDDGLPEVVLLLVEVSHTNLTEVTRMVLVDVRSVVVLTTGHTTTTGMLAVLADTTVTGRDVTTAIQIVSIIFRSKRTWNIQIINRRSIRRAACRRYRIYPIFV